MAAVQPMPSAVIPVGFQSPVEPTPLMPSAVSPNGPNVVPGADPYVSVQERLRQLGATYYLLESWGNDRQMYRFHCKIAIDGNSDYTRCFEATDADPLQAMIQVLHQADGEGGGEENDVCRMMNDEPDNGSSASIHHLLFCIHHFSISLPPSSCNHFLPCLG